MTREIGFGIVGAGMIAEYHAKAMEAAEGARPVGVFGGGEARRNDFAGRHGIKSYASLEDMLADPEVQAVSIASPSGSHGESAISCANAGKHVLCEKPLETTPARAQAIIDACRQAGVTLAPIFQYRHGAGARLIQEAIRVGRFGRMLFSSARLRWFRPQSYYDSGVWRGTWTLDGGGCLMNQGIHAIDLMILFGGVPYEVYGAAATLTHRIEVEDNAAAIVRFANGAVGTIEASTSCEPGLPLEVSVSGERGTAVLTGDGISSWVFRDSHPMDDRVASAASGSGDAASDPKAISLDGHIQTVQGMVRAILLGDRSGVIDPLEARHPLDVICGIYESQKLGRPVPLPWKP